MINYSYILLISKAHHSPPSPLALVAEMAETPSFTARAQGRGGARNQAEFTKGTDDFQALNAGRKLGAAPQPKEI